MEKLIELLNEYEFNVAESNNYAEREATEYDLDRLSERIISKKYGFIKRLVDNDKIDHKKANLFYTYYFDETWNHIDYYEAYTEYESLLMQLSIQDSPIDFLISVLK